MFSVTVGGEPYHVAFMHKHDAKHRWGSGVTACYIWKGVPLPRYPLGVSYCSRAEKFFNPAEGEKHALTKALTQYKFTKNERRYFWLAYFTARSLLDDTGA